MVKFLVAFLLLVAAALGDEDRTYDPELNYRPDNVTDLAYYLYGWRGSYYNGTAKFTLEPWDEGEDGEEVCSRYRKSTITFTFKTLVAVVERNEDDEGENPFMFLVRSWPDGVDDLWPTGGNTNPSPEQINSDIYALDSVTPTYRGLTDSGNHVPEWNITSLYRSGSSYEFSAVSNTSSEGFQLNMTHCDGTPDVWWGGSILRAEAAERWVDESLAFNPFISGRFDDRTASFGLRGFFVLNTDSSAPEDVEELWGEIVIEFEGEIDGERSDRLVGGDDVPAWEATVGFEGDDDSGAVGREAVASCTYVVLGMALLAAFY